jgi:hypothetical protein
MAISNSDKARLALTHNSFSERIQHFLFIAALQALGEAVDVANRPSKAEHDIRVPYARSVLNGEVQVLLMARAVLTNPTILGNIDDLGNAKPELVDNDIDYVVKSMFSKMAGFDGTPAAPW